MNKHYVISLKHTHKKDDFITLWRPDNRGYCYAKEYAGVYEELIEGYHNGDCAKAVEVSVLDKLFITGKLKGDNDEHLMLPNHSYIWNALGLKMTRDGLRHLLTPKN